MENNRVQVVSNVICTGDNAVIHYLGVLDWDIYDCISQRHITDEVIITEEQLRHICVRHLEVYFDSLHYVREILNNPDYIIQDKHPDTGLVVKRIGEGKESFLLVLRVCTASDQIKRKNSVITSWKITEKRLNNYLRNKRIIYSRE